MGLFDGIFGGNKKVQMTSNEQVSKHQSFSTPFLKIGKGDLSKPFISDQYIGYSGYVRFGADNLFPQVLNQLYYTSPLHAGIVEFKVNTIIGGGYEIEDAGVDVASQTNLKYFLKKNNVKKLTRYITRDFIIHAQVFFCIHFDDFGNPIKMERVAPEKVRLDRDKKTAYISSDWSKQLDIQQLPVYKEGYKHKGKVIWMYQDEGPGQEIYSLPITVGANNWIFLDGEASVLHKSNIQESIFPSLIVKRPKRFASDEEADEFKEALTRKKGASDAGFIWVLTADNQELMPEVEVVQTSGNDNLFMQTDERMDARICQAHQIDPIIMGIRVSGKLGSGMEVEQAYATFEKNYVMPTRETIEYIFDSLMILFKVQGSLVFNNFQIIEGQIVEVDDEVTTETTEVAQDPVAEDLESKAKAELKGSVGGVQGIIQIQTAVAQGLTDRSSAQALLELIYGFTPEESERLIGATPEGVIAQEGAPAQGAAPVEASNDALRGLSAAENADVYRIIRDYNKGKLPQPVAVARLGSYGFDEATINEILEIQ